MAIFYPQKILTTNKTEVTFAYNNYSSMIFANSGSAGVTIDLYVTSQIGTDITDTDSEVNGTFAVGLTTAVAITNGGTAATSDMFLNEQVWKSNGTLFGICTAFGSAAAITFGGGLVRAMANDDDLYVGTRHHFLKNVKIPKGSSLKLTSDEFKFDDTNYKLYINSSSATGDIDIITRY
tara:strand:- start:266 stop:802 length:537 start_codon:yes stop_codon:yes gene_type:complete